LTIIGSIQLTIFGNPAQAPKVPALKVQAPLNHRAQNLPARNLPAHQKVQAQNLPAPLNHQAQSLPAQSLRQAQKVQAPLNHRAQNLPARSLRQAQKAQAPLNHRAQSLPARNLPAPQKVQVPQKVQAHLKVPAQNHHPARNLAQLTHPAVCHPALAGRPFGKLPSRQETILGQMEHQRHLFEFTFFQAVLENIQTSKSRLPLRPIVARIQL